MTQPGGNAGLPYGGYGGALQNYGRTPDQEARPDQQPPPDENPTLVLPVPVDRQAPPTRIDPYVGPPLPPPTGPAAAPYQTAPQQGGTAYPSTMSYQPAMPYQPRPAPHPGPPGAPGLASSAYFAGPGARPVQRPAVIGMAATLAVTASLQWICCLSFAWLMAAVGAEGLGTDGIDGALYHTLQRFHYGMIDGLAWPLYLFPTASFVTGFIVLVRRPWARIVHTAVGVAALGWSAWWLYAASLLWWIAPAVYIAVGCLILWLPSVNRWYRAERSI